MKQEAPVPMSVTSWAGNGLDPVLGLYPLEALCGRNPPHSTIWVAPDRLRLGKRATEAGVFPVCYHHGAENGSPRHTHDFFELFLVLAGEGEYETEKGRTPLQGRDLVFVDNRVPHCLVADGDGMQILNVAFLPSAVGYDDAALSERAILQYYPLLDPFRTSSDDGSPLRFPLDGNAFGRILADGLPLVEAYRKEGGGDRDRIRPRLKSFLLSVHSRFEALRTRTRKSREDLRAIIQYCQARMGEKITLGEMALHFSLSPAYLSTLLNRGFGYGLSELINAMRIDSARNLLVETSLPISRIALEVGYRNVSHFNSVFQKRVGKAPGLYRERSSKD